MTQLSETALAATLESLPIGIMIVDRHRDLRFANLAARRLVHPGTLRVGDQLPDTTLGRSIGGLVDRAFRIGAVHESITIGGTVVAVQGTLDRHEGLSTFILEDASKRTRRHRSEEDFVVNASHEILSPIAAISGAVDVLQLGAKDDPVARDRFLGHIEVAAERLTTTATALLVLARTEAGLGGPRLELVPLRPVLEALAQGRDDMQVTCSANVGVLADADLLRQAIGILVENARLHARGGIEIVVDEAGEMVDVNIVDHGGGILPENLMSATERFGTAGGDSGGYGLGLSIAVRAAKVLGGTIELASDREGTSARLRLPSARLL